MNKENILKTTTDFVKQFHNNNTAGHDWWHVERVVKNARLINEIEKANSFVVEMSALLHDVVDYKLNDGDEHKGIKRVEEFLGQFNIEEKVTKHILSIINNISFRGGTNNLNKLTLEGKIVQDADRLDAIGAIGIARAFAYGGSKSRQLYNPAIKPVTYTSADDYKNSTAPTINHFYEKLLLLKNKMNTNTAQQIANERHMFMETYLNQFYSEWEGKK